MSKKDLIIAETAIRQDAEGRFCLNDLHKAAGGEKQYQPSNFLRLDSTKALIEEINRSSEMRNALHVIQGGRSQGTYSCKEVVYAYAMWVSPIFHLKVIRTFDAVVTGAYALDEPKSAITAAKLFKPCFQIARLIGCDKNAAALSANQAVAKLTGTNVLGLLGQTHLQAEQQTLCYTPSELGLRLGISGQKFNKLLEEKALQVREGDHWQPTEKASGYYRVFDTAKRHGDGTPVQQIKWLETVLRLIPRAA